MSWKEKIKEFGGGNFTFLSMDGDTLTFVIVGEPIQIKSTYKNKEQDRIACPVVTEEGFQLFITGKRVFRKLAKIEDKFATNAIMVIRHGAEGDVNATYQVKILPEKEVFDKLSAIAKADFEPDMITDALVEAEKAMNG